MSTATAAAAAATAAAAVLLYRIWSMAGQSRRVGWLLSDFSMS